MGIAGAYSQASLETLVCAASCITRDPADSVRSIQWRSWVYLYWVLSIMRACWTGGCLWISFMSECLLSIVYDNLLLVKCYSDVFGHPFARGGFLETDFGITCIAQRRQMRS